MDPKKEQIKETALRRFERVCFKNIHDGTVTSETLIKGACQVYDKAERDKNTVQERKDAFTGDQMAGPEDEGKIDLEPAKGKAEQLAIAPSR